MKVRVSLQRTDGQVEDLAVTADATGTVADLVDTLARADPALVPPSTTTPTLCVRAADGRAPRVLDRDAGLHDAGIHSGAQVALVAPDTQVPATATVRIHGGPDAGRTFAVPYGATTIGRSPDNDLVLTDPLVSKRHARLLVSDVAEIVDRGSANGTLVGDGHVQRAVVGPADVVRLGDTTLQVELAAGHGPVVPLEFNRSPLVAPVWAGREREAPAPPDPARPSRLPVLAMIAPAVLGAALFWFTRNPMSLVFVALSPLLLLGSYVDSRSGEKRRVARETTEYRAALDLLREQVVQDAAEEQAARRREVPDTETLVAAGLTLGPLLWSRRPEHEAFLRLNLGRGTARSRSTIRLPHRGKALAAHWDQLVALADEARDVADVPVVADLRACGALGVAGPRVDETARALVVQLITLHSPAEVVLAAVASSASAAGWDWLRWLPHVGSAHSPLPGPHLASSPAAGSSLAARVEGLLERREAAGARGAHLPVVVLLVEDDAPVERGRLVGIAERGPAVGVHVVWCASAPERLPAVCRTFVTTHAAGGASAGFVPDGVVVSPLACERLDADAALALARRLAPVTDAGAPALDESDLPRSVPYLSLVGPEIATDPSAVLERWRENGSLIDRTLPPVRRSSDASLRAVVGQGAEQELSLDLRAQGPHALVGGTTGAGKSELLQTWVLGMAAAHSPDRVTFLLVDYKGGAAFADCVELPHTVGLVTDLSPHLVRRALTSLRAELHHRERLLNRKKAKDLLALERRGDHEATPALVIVVDEFAALVNEVPEFVDGVVDVAQRGRSLGLHLILATQRPAGVIKDNLRANTNLRVALRMADEADSTDVLGDPLASGFDPGVPGRAALRTGPGRLAMFQAGYAGGRSSQALARPRVEIETLMFGPGHVWDVPEAIEPEPPQEGPTDIARTVRTIAAAAEAAGVPVPRRPWLPELAPTYDLLALAAVAPGELVLGMVDDPARQEQRAVAFRPDVDGNLAVVGASGAGKSTLLRGVAVAAGLAPEPSHVYGVDFGSGGLSMLAGLPHVGAVIDGADDERVARLVRRLVALLEDRAGRYSAARAGTLAEYRELTGDVAEPRVFLLVDGLGALREAYEAAAAKMPVLAGLARLLAEGRPLGLHVVVAAERPGAISTALGASLQRRLVLRQANDVAYATLDVPKDALGPSAVPGRAVLSGQRDEIQVAVVGGHARPSDQADALVALAERLRAGGTPEAPGVARLPTVVPFASLPDEVDGKPVLGVADETLAPVGFEPRGVFLVAGMPGSGRTNALAAIVLALRRWSPEVRMCFVGPARSTVRALDVWDDVATSAEEAAALAHELVPVLSQASGPTAEVVLVVEGLAEFLGGAAEQPLTEAVKAARRNDHLVIAEGETTSWGSSWPLVAEVRNARRGLVLQPDQVDGETIFRTPFPRMARADFPVGRCEVVESGRLRRVQLPLVAPERSGLV